MTRFVLENQRPRRVIVINKSELEKDNLCNSVYSIEQNGEENHSHSGIITAKVPCESICSCHDHNSSPGLISYKSDTFYKWFMFLLFPIYFVISFCCEIGTSFGKFLINGKKKAISKPNQNKPVFGNLKTVKNCVRNEYCQTDKIEHHRCIALDFLKDEGTQTKLIKLDSINFNQDTSGVLKNVCTQTYNLKVNSNKNVHAEFSDQSLSDEYLGNELCRRRCQRDAYQSKISYTASKSKSILCKECLLKVTGYTLSKQDLQTGRPILCFNCLAKVNGFNALANQFKNTFKHCESSRQETDNGNDDGGGDERKSDNKCSCIDCNRRWLPENSYHAPKPHVDSPEHAIKYRYTTDTDSREQEREIMYRRRNNKKTNSCKIKGKKYNEGVTSNWKQQPLHTGNINREFNETSSSNSDEAEQRTSYKKQVPKGKSSQHPPQTFRFDKPQHINNETVTETNPQASVSHSFQIHHSLVIQNAENKSTTPLAFNCNQYQSSPSNYIERFAPKIKNQWEPTLKYLSPVQFKPVPASENSCSLNRSSIIDTKARTVHEFKPSPSPTVGPPASASHTQFGSTAVTVNSSSSGSELKSSEYNLPGCKSRISSEYTSSLFPTSSTQIGSTAFPEISQNNPCPATRKRTIGVSVFKGGIPIKDSRLNDNSTQQLRSAQPNFISRMNRYESGSPTTEIVQRRAESSVIPAGNVSQEIKRNKNNTSYPDKTVFMQPSLPSKQNAFMTLMSQMGRGPNARMLPMPFARPPYTPKDNTRRQTGMELIQNCKYIPTRPTRPSRLERNAEMIDSSQPNRSFSGARRNENHNCDDSSCTLPLDRVPDIYPEETEEMDIEGSHWNYFGLKY